MKPLPLIALSALILAACSPAAEPSAPAEPAATFERSDFADLDTWLCHPGKSANNACETDLTATVILEDGSTEIATFTAAAAPAFDCFYLYPTVSLDPAPNSDMIAGPEELNVVANQFARYGQTCRLYAPIYRQATLLSLRTAMLTGTATANVEMRWADILDSWNHYLEHENNGRGVVLVGHSQGAGMILQLLKTEILGTPIEHLIISAHPVGTTAHLDTDGTFGGMPVCTAPGQAGCLISFLSFRAKSTPPEESRFGKLSAEGGRATCANPAAFSGDGSALDAYMPRQSLIAASDNSSPYAYGAPVETPFVKLPGLLSAECQANATHDWLAVSINAGNGPRADDIPGDLIFEGQLLADWGLHLVDMNIAMGNLVGMAELQSQQWLTERASGE